MIKLDYSNLEFLDEENGKNLSNVIINRKIKTALDHLEVELTGIEVGDIPIIVNFSGKMVHDHIPKTMVKNILPNSLPAEIRNAIEGMINTVLEKHIPDYKLRTNSFLE